VRFEAADVVRETYAFTGPDPMEATEFQQVLLDRCGYPGVVNVFFVGEVKAGQAGRPVVEAALSASPEERAAAGSLPGAPAGVALGDRAVAEDGTETAIGAIQRVQLLAHGLGHFLTLPELDASAPNAPRLMREGVTDGVNRRLEESEVTRARASKGAAADCVPLRLKVTGAVVIGGSLNNRFLAVVDPASPPAVTVDAEIPDAMLDPKRGTLVMAGGAAGATDRQRTVSTAASGPPVEVTATYTPAGGGTPTVRRVFIHVVTFALRIVSPTPVPAGNLFRRTGPGPRISIEAALDPPLFCVPDALVAWEKGDATPDPLLRTVPRTKADRTTVKATVAGIMRELTVTVFDIALVENTAPFENRVQKVMIGGVLTSELAAFDPAAGMIPQRAEALFRVRVDLPGSAAASVSARLATDLPGGEPLDLVLPAGADGVFLSTQAVLAIPRALPRNDVKLKNAANAAVIRTRAEGTLTLTVSGELAAEAPLVLPVAGRVVRMCFITIKGAKPNHERDMESANRVYAQVGMEVRRVGPDTVIDDPTLQHLEYDADNSELYKKGKEECTAPTKLRCYYTRTNDAGYLGWGAESRMVLFDAAKPTTFPHELGHCMDLKHSAEKTDPSPTQAQKDNLMYWQNQGHQAHEVLLTDAQFVQVGESEHVKILG